MILGIGMNGSNSEIDVDFMREFSSFSEIISVKLGKNFKEIIKKR